VNSPRLAIRINISNCTPKYQPFSYMLMGVPWPSWTSSCWYHYYVDSQPYHQIHSNGYFMGFNDWRLYSKWQHMVIHDFNDHDTTNSGTEPASPTGTIKGRRWCTKKWFFMWSISFQTCRCIFAIYTHTFSYIYTYTYTHMHLYTCNNCNKSLMAYCYFGIATPTRTNHCSFEVAVRLLYNFPNCSRHVHQSIA
jgi:hypothetical protein